MSSVSGAGGFRDEWMNNIMNSDGKTNSTQSTTQTGQVWNAVFEDENDMGVSVDDFLNLMVAQLRNQDFMNPVDDTQYVTQLAQFATMSQMQELAANMKNNYALSLVGTNVTAAKFAVSGALINETGPISKVSLVDKSYPWKVAPPTRRDLTSTCGVTLSKAFFQISRADFSSLGSFTFTVSRAA